MNKRKRMQAVFAAGVVLTFVLAGCGAGGEGDSSSSLPPSQNEQALPDEVSGAPVNAGEGVDNAGTGNPEEESPSSNETASDEAEAPQPERETVVIHYTDDQLNELVTRDKQIVYRNEQEKLEAIFAALQTDTDDVLALWDNMPLNGIRLEEGLLTVDIGLPPEAQMGSTGEGFAIDALLETYFALPEVERIQIVVDGQERESLMGHVALEYPFQKSN